MTSYLIRPEQVEFKRGLKEEDKIDYRVRVLSKVVPWCTVTPTHKQAGRCKENQFYLQIFVGRKTWGHGLHPEDTCYFLQDEKTCKSLV